jgi:hypothetical protein
VYSDLLNGPLSFENLTNFVNQLETALTPYVAEDPYLSIGEFDGIRQFFATRIANVRGQIGALTGPPVLSRQGGEIISGFQLRLSHTNGSGTIYYTYDGTDPRGLGGIVKGTAYTGPLTLTNTTHILCRTLTSTNWSALRKAAFSVAGHADGIRITEIMYNPLPSPPDGDAGDYEFIELKNIGLSPVNLSGYSFGGIGYTFAPGTVMAPGEIMVLVSHPLRFTERYPGIAFHGAYLGGLSRTGEKIRLRDPAGNTVLSVEYDDDPPWGQGANGFGHSLVNINLNGNPDDPDNWRESSAGYGSPGADDPVPPYDVGVVVNEVLAHTDPPLEDAIELFNPTADGIDIGNWYLSDSMDLLDPTRASLKKYRIPAGTVVPANGYKVFYEEDFNPTVPDAQALIPFAMSSRGEQVWLSSADGGGNLTGHIVGFRFEASDNGVSIGRHPTSTGTDITFLDRHTFGVSSPASDAEFRTGTGALSAAPRIGPVIFNELMYHPADGGNEYIEFLNISTGAVDLAGWSLEGASGYIFPSNSIIQPQGYLILLATTNITEAAFRAAQSVPLEVPVLQHAFDLQNAGERFTLSKPNDPPTDPPIPVDSVRYNDRSPWPTEADGEGPSLERVSSTAYGNDPLSWRTAADAGTPGRPGLFGSVIAITTNSSWNHFEKGFNLGTPWRSALYADSSWDTSDGILGTGLPFVDSILDYAPFAHPPVTTYFRKEFVISDDPGSLSQLELKVNYDDGFVAYINGQEVARRSMPAGVPSFDTLAFAHEGGSYEVIDLMAHTNVLQQGGNTLAVELHQASVSDPDLVWDAALLYSLGTAAPIFTGIAYDPEGNIVLEWISVSGQTYYVEGSADLGGWSDIAGPLQAIGPLTQYSHPIAPTDTNGFLRVRTSD